MINDEVIPAGEVPVLPLLVLLYNFNYSNGKICVKLAEKSVRKCMTCETGVANNRKFLTGNLT